MPSPHPMSSTRLPLTSTISLMAVSHDESAWRVAYERRFSGARKSIGTRDSSSPRDEIDAVEMQPINKYMQGLSNLSLMCLRLTRWSGCEGDMAEGSEA